MGSGSNRTRASWQVWLIASVAVFVGFSFYLRDWAATLQTRLAMLPVLLIAAASAGWVLQRLWSSTSELRNRSSGRTKRFCLIGIIVLLVGASAGYFARHAILREYDTLRLAAFSRRIAEADRVVASWEGAAVELTLAGDDLRKLLEATSAARTTRMPNIAFMCTYSAKAAFQSGTNVLGEIVICEDLFILDGGGPPFSEASGVLQTAIYMPLLDAVRGSLPLARGR